MAEDRMATLKTALDELGALDDDRRLEDLDARYPVIIAACVALSQLPPTAPGDPESPSAAAFVIVERDRIARGEAPSWTREQAMAQVEDGAGAAGAAYVMDLALVDWDGRSVDVRDLLRSFLAMYGA